jgi:tetratricopeptide (TPR) repeat protein
MRGTIVVMMWGWLLLPAGAAPVPRDVLRNDWVGQQIYLRSPSLTLTVEGLSGQRTVTMPQYAFGYWVIRQDRDRLICGFGSEKLIVPIFEAMTTAQAIEFYSEELDAKPSHVQLRSARAWAYQDSKRHDEAEADYSKLLEIDSNNLTWRYSRAAVRVTAKKFSAALEDYDLILQRSPDWSDALQGRANAKIGLKKFDDAIADLTRMIQVSGNQVSGYLARGLAYDRIGRYKESLADYEQALKIVPENPTALNNKAWLFSTCPDETFRDGKQALKFATRACELTEWKNAGYLDTLAAVHAELGDFDNAAKRQREAMRDPKIMKDEGEELKHRLELYLAKKPYRQTPEK